MTNQQQEMIEYTTQEVVRYLIEDNGISMEHAMEQFYMSGVFEKLNDIETGLYLEGSAYIYEMLKREVQESFKRYIEKEKSGEATMEELKMFLDKNIK